MCFVLGRHQLLATRWALNQRFSHMTGIKLVTCKRTLANVHTLKLVHPALVLGFLTFLTRVSGLNGPITTSRVQVCATTDEWRETSGSQIALKGGLQYPRYHATPHPSSTWTPKWIRTNLQVDLGKGLPSRSEDLIVPVILYSLPTCVENVC